MMPTRDPEHWLWRLDAAAWLAAGQGELEQARQHLGERRRAVTHARRGAGMVLNGVLVTMGDRGWSDERCETMWGRSYIDHLRALAQLADAPADQNPLGPDASTLADQIMSVPVVPSGGLVQLRSSAGAEVRDTVDRAQRLADLCAAFVAPSA